VPFSFTNGTKIIYSPHLISSIILYIYCIYTVILLLNGTI